MAKRIRRLLEVNLQNMKSTSQQDTDFPFGSSGIIDDIQYTSISYFLFSRPCTVINQIDNRIRGKILNDCWPVKKRLTDATQSFSKTS